MHVVPIFLRIQDQLLHSLHSHPTNWPTLIQNHALDLLRSGEVTTFPALLRRVMDDVRHDNAAAAGGAKATNGTSEVNGSSGSAGKKAANGGRASTTDDGDGDDGGDASAGADGEHTGQIQRRGRGQAGAAPSLALPPSVVEDALRVTRESLEMVCEIEDTGAA